MMCRTFSPILTSLTRSWLICKALRLAFRRGSRPDQRNSITLDTMLVLGIDPGLTRCGVGAVSGAPGQILQLIDVGVIRSSAELPVELRLLEISNGLIEWIEKIKPDSIAVERVFAQANRASAMETAQAAGIALLLAAQRNIPVALHTPTEVKAAVTGSGVAGKPQVGEMVKRLLKLDEIPKPADSADALALAICHIIRAPMKARIESARLR